MAITITKPTVGGNEDTWGTTINTALDTIVDAVNGTSGTTAPNLSTLTINGTDVTSTAAELNKLDGFSGTFEDLNYAKDLRATGVTSTEFNKLDGLTASTSELNKLDGVTATTAELNYVDGVTSNIQTQIDAKQATITGGATTIDTENLTASRVLVSNSSGKVAVSSVTSTELAKIDGLTASASELNKLDGATVTTSELNVLDGGTSATSTTVAAADRVVFNDNGTMKQVSMSDIATYTSSQVSSPTVNNSTITISAGNALTGGGSITLNQSSNETVTINHEDTSSQSSVNNSGSTVIQDITLDTYGHITGITSTDVATAIGSAGTLVGYGAGAGLNGDGNCDLKANTSYLFYAPNTTSTNVYIYQNNNGNDRIVNGTGGATIYVYNNGSSARSDVGMGGVSGGSPGPHLIFELS